MGIKRIKIRSLGLIIFLSIIVISSILIIGLYSGLDLILLFTALYFGCNIIYACRNIRTHLSYLMFMSTLFLFMLSKVLLDILLTGEWLANYSYEIKKQTITIILISLFSLSIGACLYNVKNKIKYNKGKNLITQIDCLQNDNLLIYSKVALILFYISYLPDLLQTIDIVRYTITDSYISLYTSYQSSLPVIIRKVGDMNTVTLVTLFVTNTPKRKIKVPLILFLLNSFLSLFGGQRNICVLNVIMIIYLYVYRDKKSKSLREDKWITKKHKIALLILVPFFILLLSAIGTYRYNKEFDLSTKDAFLNFASSQGGQVEFLSLSIENEDNIWKQQVPYSFGTVYEYFTQNSIAYTLINTTYIKPYTIDYALRGNSFASTLYYIISPDSLLSGKGMGNNYLAELYYDFGYIGVIVSNVFIGYVLIELWNLIDARRWYLGVITIFMLRWIVYIPRASFLTWVVNSLSLTNIFTLLIIVIIGTLIRKDKRYDNYFVY